MRKAGTKPEKDQEMTVIAMAAAAKPAPGSTPRELYSADAEHAVLGGLMIDNTALDLSLIHI